MSHETFSTVRSDSRVPTHCCHVEQTQPFEIGSVYESRKAAAWRRQGGEHSTSVVMSPDLERPSMADGMKSPESCQTSARQSPRKIARGELGEVRGGKNLPTCCQAIEELRSQVRATSGQCGCHVFPELSGRRQDVGKYQKHSRCWQLTHLGKTWAVRRQHGSKLAPDRPSWVKCCTMLAKLGPKMAQIGQNSTERLPKVGCRSKCSATCGQLLDNP